MHSAQLALALLLAVAALVTIARRLRIAYPIFLVIGGLLLGLVPGTPRVEIDPDLIFLFVLPPLLYIAAFFTPLGNLRANLGAIGSLAVGLVVASALAPAAVGWIVAQIRARIEDTPVEITISLLTPYAAFLPAQQLGASGVIATVAAGLYLGRRGSRIMGPDARLTGRAVWETITFLLNGVVFIITGLEVPLLLRALAPAPAIRLVGIGIVVGVVLVVVRALWIFPTEFLAPLVRGEPRPPHLLAHSLVLSWAGMRGVVSLAVALALPLTLPDGGPFPARESLLIVTLTVIVFTLLGQGLTLPWLIRRLRLGTDPELRDEEARARQQLLEAATRRIDQLYPVWPGHRPLSPFSDVGPQSQLTRARTARPLPLPGAPVLALTPEATAVILIA